MVQYCFTSKFTALFVFLNGLENHLIAPTAWHYIDSLNQSKFFLAMVLTSFNISSLIVVVLVGFMVKRFGHPKIFCIGSIVVKIFGSMTYSINISAYFPLFGRILSGLGNGCVSILIAQIGLQVDKESRAANFIVVDGVYCLGSVVGPSLGSLILIRANIFGFTIDDGNSPAIIALILWIVFLIFALFTIKYIWSDTAAEELSASSTESEDEKNEDYQLISEKQRRSQLWNSKILCLLS